MSKPVTYLKTFGCPWPIFRTKYYKKDEDGWWNPIPRNIKKDSKIFSSNL